jgi:hypothetical protein
MTQPPHDKPSATDLSIDERLALVEAFEQREAGAVRKAAGIAWLSLILAAVLLGVLVFGAWSQLRRVRSEVSALTEQQNTLVRSTNEQKAELARVDGELRDKRAALSTLIAAIRRTDEEARGGLETALDADPRATTLVPRTHVQIVDEQDRQWARNLSDRLQQAGIIPIGIDYVRKAAALRQFEVRYYKKAEEAGATRILSVLKSVGVPAAPVYLNLETDTRVRRNHFEIWCPPNARQHKLPPMAPLTP